MHCQVCALSGYGEVKVVSEPERIDVFLTDCSCEVVQDLFCYRYVPVYVPFETSVESNNEVLCLIGVDGCKETGFGYVRKTRKHSKSEVTIFTPFLKSFFQVY